MVGRYDDADDTAFWRDLLIAMYHPRFEDQSTIDALGDLYRHRRDQRREQHRHDLRTTNL